MKYMENTQIIDNSQIIDITQKNLQKSIYEIYGKHTDNR